MARTSLIMLWTRSREFVTIATRICFKPNYRAFVLEVRVDRNDVDDVVTFFFRAHMIFSIPLLNLMVEISWKYMSIS